MRSPHIIVPGAEPPKVDTSGRKFGALKLGVNDDNKPVSFAPVYALKGKRAEDMLLNNPQFQPFVVSIPFIRSRLTIDPNIEHDIVFIRGSVHDGVGVGLGAVTWWDSLICGRFYGEFAESGGAPVVQVLDEEDAAEMWAAAVRLHKSDTTKYRMVAIGDKHIPFFFCIPGSSFGFERMKRVEHFNLSRRGESFHL